MVIAPILRPVKTACPDAQARGAGGGFLAPVIARGDCQSLGHHDGSKVALANGAAGQEAPVLVMIFWAASYGAEGQQRRHAVAGGAATGPIAAIDTLAKLRELGSVEAKQAHTITAEAQAVAIAGARQTGDGRRRRVKTAGNQRYHRQDKNPEQSPTAARKNAASIGMPIADFTTR